MSFFKKLLSPIILPWFTLGAGALGLILNIFLFSAIDEKGLLPASHASETLLYLLTAFVFLILFLCVRKINPKTPYRELYSADILRAVGSAIGAVGIFLRAISVGTSGKLETLTLIAGIIGALALAYIAYLRFVGKRPSYLCFLAVLVFLVLNTVCASRLWSIEPQMHAYFYPLLANIFLMFNTYYLAEMAGGSGNSRVCVLLNQATLFLCCICMPSKSTLFYVTMSIWLLLDLCTIGKASSAEEA